MLGQHRAIVSASRSRLYAPLLQLEKREIHTVFLRFPNFELSQTSRLGLLAKLCGVALGKSPAAEKTSLPDNAELRSFFLRIPTHW